MLTYFSLAIGGILGCWARYGLTQVIQAFFGRNFPLATLCVNVLGSFVLAFLFVLTLERVVVSPVVRTGMLTGGLGAFTTFSTFMMEALLLVEEGETGKAVLYLALSLALGLSAAFAGVALARNV